MKIGFAVCLLLLMTLFSYQGGPTPIIEPLKIDPTDLKSTLTVLNPTEVLLVNMIPKDQSDEKGQDSEPFLAVNSDHNLMIGAAFRGKYQETGTEPLLLGSTDGGMTWKPKAILPATKIGAQTYCFSGKGNSFYGSILTMGETEQAVSVFHSDDPATGQPLKIISTLSSGPEFGDAPFIQAFADGPPPQPSDETDKRVDKIFVGQNYFGFTGTQKTRTASIRVSVDDGKTFRLLGIEARDTGTAKQDGPAVRPAVAKDGKIYVAFLHWNSREKNQIRGDVVVTRDDNAAAGDKPFRDLVDPSDGLPGRIVTKDSVFSFEKLAKQRVISPLALAVNPAHSEIVYVAWGDYNVETKTHILHVKRSTDRGQNWSEDLLSISSATNPALAVSNEGVVGLLYQQLVDAKTSRERWETHFRSNEDGSDNWTDIPLSTFPTADEPPFESDPYLGDRSHLLAVESNFYGTFSAPNKPIQAYFPQGVSFQRRNVNGQLLSSNGDHGVPTSIDPYFFRIARKTYDNPTSFFIDPGEGTSPQSTIVALLSWKGTPIIALGCLLAISLLLVKRARDNRKFTEQILGPALTNYKGFVTARFTDLQNNPISETYPGSECKLIVEFTQKEPSEDWFEIIDLHGGVNASQVVFRIVIDHIDFILDEDHKTVSIPSKGTSTVSFDVKPRWNGAALFVQVFQKTRLVQVVSPRLVVYVQPQTT